MPEEMPPSFPPMTLSIMRALCVIAKDREDGGWRSKDENLTSSGDANSKSCSGKATTTLLLDALDAFFAEYWVNHVPTYEPAELRRVLRRLLGDEGAENGACIYGGQIPFTARGLERKSWPFSRLLSRIILRDGPSCLSYTCLP